MAHKRMHAQKLSFHSWTKLKQQIWEWRGVWMTAPVVTGIVLALRLTGLLQTLEWAALDEFFRRRPVESPDPAIVIVGIDESDLQVIGKWPISDAVLAKLINKIKQHRPSAIGLDLYRDLPVEPGQADLVQVFKTTPNLIGIEKKVGDPDSPAIRSASVLQQLGQVGVNDIVPDADGKIRRGLLIWFNETGDWAESLGLKLAQLYLAPRGITPDPEAPELQLGGATFIRFQANDGGYVQADDGGYQILLNFRGPARSFQKVSVMEVLQDRISQNLLRDRIVLIGPTAPSLKDFFYTPYSGGWTQTPEQTAGVEIQAHLASQVVNSALFDRPGISVWAAPLEWLWIFGWAVVGAIAGWRFRTARLIPIVMLVLSSVLIGGCFLAFLGGWWLPVVPPVLTLVGSVIVITRYIAELEREDRKTVMNLFGRHVTPQVAEAIWRDRHQILKQGRMRGQQITATVLFSDIVGFSRIAEQAEPEVLMDWLNEYMGAMAQLVLDHGGVVDKFIGDAVMAVFGAPIPSLTEEEIAWDAQQAVDCALAMATKLQALNQKWQAQGRPTAAMRIGISTGTVVTGSLGSSQRLDYTTIGDSVNVASRLESYDQSAKIDTCRILISQATYLRSQDHFRMQEIGSVLLRGRDQPLTVYQVLLEQDSH